MLGAAFESFEKKPDVPAYVRFWPVADIRPGGAADSVLMSASDPKRSFAAQGVAATVRIIGMGLVALVLASCSDAPRVEKSGRLHCERSIALTTPASLSHISRQLVAIAGDHHLGSRRDSATESALRDQFGSEPMLLYLTRLHGSHEALHVAAMRVPPAGSLVIQVYVDGTDERTARQLCTRIQRISTSAPVLD